MLAVSPSRAFAAVDAKLAFQRILDGRQLPDGRQRLRGNGTHVVEEAGNENPTLIVAHFAEQLRGHRRRVRHPVAVVAVVHGTHRPVHGHFQSDHTARAKVERRFSRLMHRGVTDEPQIAGEALAVCAQDPLEVRRAGFFFSVPHHLDVDGGFTPGRGERVEGAEEGNDRRLVVRDRPAEQAPLRVKAARGSLASRCRERRRPAQRCAARARTGLNSIVKVLPAVHRNAHRRPPCAGRLGD